MKLGGMVIACAMVFALAACSSGEKASESAVSGVSPTAQASTPLPTPTPSPAPVRAVDQSSLYDALLTIRDVGSPFVQDEEKRLSENYANLQRCFERSAPYEMLVAYLQRDNERPLDDYAAVVLDAFQEQGVGSRTTLAAPRIGRDVVRYRLTVTLGDQPATLDLITWRDHAVIAVFYQVSAATANVLLYAEKQQERLTEVFRPGAMAASRVTAVPQRTATPQPSPTPNAAAIAGVLYTASMAIQLGELEKQQMATSGPLGAPNLISALWWAQVRDGFNGIRATIRTTQGLDPPACYGTARQAFLRANDALDRSADLMVRSTVLMDAGNFTAAGTLIDEAVPLLDRGTALMRQAGDILARTRCS